MTTNKKVEEAAENLGINEEMTQEEEFDLVTGFLKAAETLSEETKTYKVRRGKKVLFSFRLHALSEPEMKQALKKSTTYMPNPKGKRLPPIEKERDQVKYNSYIIYLATVDEDRAKIWDNPELKQKLGVMESYELIDKVLRPGDKDEVINLIDELCGYGEDDLSDIDIAKNS